MRTYFVDTITSLSSNVMLLTLQPRRQADVLKFYPGQYACISFKKDGRPSPMRCFSIVSSPNDRQRLQFAIRIQGRFTSAAARLQRGDEVSVQGPFGEFAIDERQDQNVVMMAGGIGITPSISMLRHATETGLKMPITLLYSCRSQHDIPFFDELLELERRNPHVRIIFFVTDGNVREIPGARIVGGGINKAWIERMTGDAFHNGTYFLCGPNGFMLHLEKQLIARQVDPNKILTESFTQSAMPAFGSRFSLQAVTYAFAALLLLFGIGSIMALDLDRTVPKLAAAQTVKVTSSTSSTPASTASSGTTSSNTSSTGSSTTPITTTTTPATSSTSTAQTYQAPVSSVS
jgi:ferredoxin-NADP reductase